MRAYAACSFGLEAVVAEELRQMGIEEIAVRDARVYFSGEKEELARANICLTAADRVYLVLSEFSARDFQALFEGVSQIEWADWLPKNARFPVLADAVHSQLKSVRDIQAISKKAIVEALKRRYGLSFYREEGAVYSIYVSLLKDVVTVCLNTSGLGLNRRGYRVKNGAAPLRETLAAGLLRLTKWRDRPFYDILCGSGTIPIEAALKALNRAPGLSRRYEAESWTSEWTVAFEKERERARECSRERMDIPIFAADIDPKAVEMARFHARRAKVEPFIHFRVADARSFCPETPEATVLINPPYAIRLGEKEEVHTLYRELGKILLHKPEIKCYVVSADAQFERFFGKHADKKRKVYNGNIQCGFYQYFR